MEFSVNTITTISTILLTGLSAGLCFTWTNAITPGIGRLDDLGYLQSFQEMNRAIINPIFLIVFFGPFFLHIINVYLNRNQPSAIFWMVFTAGILYIAGVIVITIFGNIPLNELLENAELEMLSPDSLKQLRNNFENKWNLLHLIRTITAVLSFVLLIITLLQNQINSNTTI